MVAGGGGGVASSFPIEDFYNVYLIKCFQIFRRRRSCVLASPVNSHLTIAKRRL